MGIIETLKQIVTGKEQVSQDQQQVQAFDPRIFQTQTQLRQATPTTQAGIQQQQIQRGQIKEQTLQDIQQQEQALKDYEQELQDYLKTPSGIMQYAQEAGIKGNPVYGYATGYGREGEGEVIIGYKYKTPYGEVTDYSPQQKYLKSESEALARSLGYSSASEMSKQKQFTSAMFPQGGIAVTPSGARIDIKTGTIQSQYESLGLKPIIQNGQIIGFEDRPITLAEKWKSGQVASQDIYFTPSGIQYAEKTPIKIDVSPPKVSNFFNALTSTGLIGISGVPWSATKEILQAPLKFATGSYEWQKKLIPDTRDQQAEREYLEKMTEIKIPFVNKTIPSPLRVFDIAAGGVVTASEKITGAPIPEAFRKPVKQTIADIFKFGFFAPAISSGTYRESEYVYDYSKGKFVKKGADQILEFAEKRAPTKAEIEALENNIRDGYINGQISNQQLRNAYRNALNTENSALIKDSENLLRNALGKSTANTIIKDIRAQEIISSPIVKPIIDIPANIPSSEFLAASKFAGTGLYEKTWSPEEAFLKAREQFLRTPRDFAEPKSFFETPSGKTQFTGLSGLFGATKFKDLGVLGSTRISPAVSSLLGTGQVNWLGQPQISKTREATRTREGLITGLGVASALALGLKTAQVQRQVQKTIQTPGFRGNFNFPRYRWGWWFGFSRKTSSLKIRTRIKRLKELPLTIEIRRKGIFKPIAQVKDLGKAIQIGKAEARKTLAASFRIKGPKGYLSLQPTQEFRKSKQMKDPFSLIQVSRARLTSPTERKEIQRAKKSRQGGSFW